MEDDTPIHRETDLSTRVLSSPEEILESVAVATHGVAHTWSPRIFLASIASASWIPRVCQVQSRRGPAFVLAKERRVMGLRSGIVLADGTLGQLVIADPSERQYVLAAGLTKLLSFPGVSGLRLLVPPDGYEEAIARQVRSRLSLDLASGSVANHAALPLHSDYESFLARLGSRTRRNFRYYRRRCEADGHRYLGNLSLKEFQTGAAELSQRHVVGRDPDGLSRALKIVSAVPNPLLVGLGHRDGGYLAVLGGWLEPNRAVVFLQMNDDRENASYSLSLVLRAYLIEQLIGQGYPELVFWAGVGGPISHYTHPVPAQALFLDKRTTRWWAIRKSVDALRPMLPPRFANLCEWVSFSACRSE